MLEVADAGDGLLVGGVRRVEASMKVCVIYGQGGIITSFGMYLLSQRIAGLYPAAVVTTYSWDNPAGIATDISEWRASGTGHLVVIGYSLGANCVTWIPAYTVTPIDLAVCYDPSVLSIVTNPAATIKRLLLYHNSDWEPEGHAVLVGPQVERTEISMLHLSVCYSEMLHQKTLAAIAQLFR
jgi:hypothetical protein